MKPYHRTTIRLTQRRVRNTVETMDTGLGTIQVPRDENGLAYMPPTRVVNWLKVAMRNGEKWRFHARMAPCWQDIAQLMFTSSRDALVRLRMTRGKTTWEEYREIRRLTANAYAAGMYAAYLQMAGNALSAVIGRKVHKATKGPRKPDPKETIMGALLAIRHWHEKSTGHLLSTLQKMFPNSSQDTIKRTIRMARARKKAES